MTSAAKVRQNSSTSDSQLPAKTQKILDEKNDLILKMREEIQATDLFSLFRIHIIHRLLPGDEDDDKRPYRRRVFICLGSGSEKKHLDGGSGDAATFSNSDTILSTQFGSVNDKM